MTELPNPEVFEHWEEKVKAWKDVQSVVDWIRSDRDLYKTLMRVHRGEVTVAEGFASYKATIDERGRR